ncbi:hypothetical protein F4780DRAFT_710347 [Xylariomycetidae sp. FL0641]|nr:hypothetical protein F4780DRAFT_710347 [Xylariomycetidae sp. FL0641]
MPNDPITSLGLSCPDGGSFYVCRGAADNNTNNSNNNNSNNSTQSSSFLGCCSVDPCTDAHGNACPEGQLHPASFSAAAYADIPAQGCASAAAANESSSSSSSAVGKWYTCSAGPFLGCCASNPCGRAGVCPAADLVPARLAADPDAAAIFLTATASVAAPAEEEDPSAMGTGAGGISAGCIAGIVIAGVALVAIVAGLLVRWRRKRRGGGPGEEEAAGAGEKAAWSPYSDTFKRSPTYPLPSPPPSAARPPPQGSPSVADSFFSPLSGSIKDVNRWESKEDYSRRAYHEQEKRGVYRAGTGVEGDGKGAGGIAELDANIPVREMDAPAPGVLPLRRTFHDRKYHEMEGSMPRGR